MHLKALNVAERTGTIPVHSGKICGNGTLAKLLLPIGAHSSESFGGKSSAEDCLAAVNHPVDDGEHRGHDDVV